MAGSSHTFDENRDAAQRSLARFAADPLPHLIGGACVPSTSGETFDNHSPIDGALLGAVAAGDAADIDAAARAAHEAFHTWSTTPGPQRQKAPGPVPFEL